MTLNITAPVEASAAPRPVMVFIHGGGYILGTSALGLYSGARLAVRGDVIVVSLNYRLGAFGYVDFGEFSTGTRQFDSNLGLRDQVAALEWVQRNIGAFGGDPGNVTIFGESAGAHAVLTLFATPAAAGLFHRGIAQSPPADWSTPKDEARLFARRCLKGLGTTPEDADRALIQARPNDIRRAVDRAVADVLRDQPGLFPVAPTVDGDYLPLSPIDALTGGSAHRLPLIVGSNRDEGTLFARFDAALPTTPASMRKLLSHSSKEVESRITAAYPGFPNPKVAVRMGGDFVLWRSTVTAMEGHSRYAPTYGYRFDFAPRALQLAGFGATHALDLVPVFGAGDTPFGRALTAAGGRRGLRSVTRQFQDNWLSFARSGKPLPSWPEYTADRRTTMIIDYPPRLEDDPDRTKRLAWQDVRVPSLT